MSWFSRVNHLLCGMYWLATADIFSWCTKLRTLFISLEDLLTAGNLLFFRNSVGNEARRDSYSSINGLLQMLMLLLVSWFCSHSPLFFPLFHFRPVKSYWRTISGRRGAGTRKPDNVRVRSRHWSPTNITGHYVCLCVRDILPNLSFKSSVLIYMVLVKFWSLDGLYQKGAPDENIKQHCM